MTEVENVENVETPAHDCGCDAKLADLTAAIQIQADTLEKVVNAVNSIGQMIQSIQEQASGFFGQMKGINPLDALKGLVLGGKR